MINCEDGTYDWIRATVRNDGIHLHYQVTGLKITGSDTAGDDSAKEWTDNQVRDVIAMHLGLNKDKKNLAEIELEFDVMPDDDEDD